jgi:hypothetical protein
MKPTIKTSLWLRVSIFILSLSLSHILADEEDVFESDFESTDDEAEAAQEIPDSGEKQARAEERREKKVISSVFSELVKLSYNIGSPKSV